MELNKFGLIFTRWQFSHNLSKHYKKSTIQTQKTRGGGDKIFLTIILGGIMQNIAVYFSIPNKEVSPFCFNDTMEILSYVLNLLFSHLYYNFGLICILHF